jgi:nucleoid DNA-binding protein
MPNLTKKELIAEITNRLAHRDLTQDDVTEVLDSILDLIVERLSQGDNVSLRKFGQFVVVESPERIGRNPKKPLETSLIPARSLVKFRPSNETKSEVAKALPFIRQSKMPLP